MMGKRLLIISLFFYLNTLANFSEKDSLLPKLNPQARLQAYEQLYESSMKNYKQEEAIVYANKSLLLVQKYGILGKEYNILMNIMRAYISQGDYQKAIEIGNGIIERYKHSPDKFKVARTYHEIGSAYLMLHIFDRSLSNFLDALKIVEDSIGINNLSKLKKIQAIILNNIGNVYSKMNASNKALVYYDKAYSIRKQLADTLGIASSLQNIGVCYEKQDNLQKSLIMYRKALTIRKEYNKPKDLAEILSNIGIIHFKMMQLDTAFHYLIMARQNAARIQAHNTLALTDIYLAYLLLKTAKTDKALTYIEDYYEIHQKYGENTHWLNYYDLMAKYYYQIGEYEKSFSYKDKQLEQKDSLFNQQLSDKISALQISYELESKEKKINLLNKNNEIQAIKIQRRSFLLLVLGLLLGLTILLFLLIMNRRKLKQQHLKTELKRKNLEMQQKLILSQMNPHFIFNSLNSIQSYISNNDSFKAMKYLSKFAMLIRSTLDNSRQETISVQEEIASLETYIQLEQLRYQGKFTYSISAEKNLSLLNIYIPPMIIQAFVENAIKHGFNDKNIKGKLEIAFSLQEDFLLCSVQDNGIGRVNAAKIQNGNSEHHKSLGMEITKERLESIAKITLLHSRYEIIDLLDENQLAIGTKVLIYLPYEKD